MHQTLHNKYHLSGYITRGEPIRKQIEGKEYEIVRYQGDHENEFCVYEVKDGEYNGRAQLFDDGILKMAWRMNNGIREGHVYMYDKGRLLKESQWNWLESEEEERWIENDKEKQVLVIRDCQSNQPLYVGEYNDKMEREGYGIEYTNGSLKLSGYWVNDELIHVHQRVLNQEEMIEYGGEKTDKNTNVLDRRPIYIGEFKVDKENRLLKHGSGCMLDEYNGVCIKECEWEMGVQIENKIMELKNGRYKEGETDESMRKISSGYSSLTNGNSSAFIMHTSTEVIDIASNNFNTKEITELKIISFPYLKRLSIADGCFKNVTRFSLDDLNELEMVRVGKKSFLRSSKIIGYVQFSVFTISNCPKLMKLIVENDVFSGCETFELINLPSLRVMYIGNRAFQFAYNFKLTGVPLLREMVIEENCFKTVRSFVMDGYSELEVLKIGNKSFTSPPSHWNHSIYGKIPPRYGGFKLINCNSLKSLQIGNGVFSWYTYFSLSNVPTLKYIIIGDDCFQFVSHFEINGLNELETISIGKTCFTYNGKDPSYYHYGGELIVANCPILYKIEVAQESFVLFTNFELKNNPLLRILQLGDNVIRNCQSVVFEGIND